MKKQIKRRTILLFVLLATIPLLSFSVSQTLGEEEITEINIKYNGNGQTITVPTNVEHGNRVFLNKYNSTWGYPTKQINSVNYQQKFIGWSINGKKYTYEEHYALTDSELQNGIIVEAVYGFTVYLSAEGHDGNDGLTPATPVRTVGKAYELLAKYDTGNQNANINGTKVTETAGIYSATADTANYEQNYNGIIIVMDDFKFANEFEGRYEYITYGECQAGQVDISPSKQNVCNPANTAGLTGYAPDDLIKFTGSYTSMVPASTSATSAKYALKNKLNTFEYEYQGNTYTSYGRLIQYSPVLRAHTSTGLNFPKTNGIVMITSDDGITNYKTGGAQFLIYDTTRHSFNGPTIFENIQLRFKSDTHAENKLYVGGLAAYGNHLVMGNGITISTNSYNGMTFYATQIYGGGYAYRAADNINYSSGSNLGDSGTTSQISTNLTVKSGTYNAVIGGAYGQSVGRAVATYGYGEDNASVLNLYGGSPTYAGGGGHEGGSSYNSYSYAYGIDGSTQLNGAGPTVGSSGGITGAGNSNVYVSLSKGNISTIYGGSGNGSHNGTSNVTVDNGTITTLYGGNASSAITGNINITINNGTIGSLTGGCATGNVGGKITININGGIVSNNIYTSGQGGTVTNSTTFFQNLTGNGNPYYDPALTSSDPRLDYFTSLVFGAYTDMSADAANYRVSGYNANVINQTYTPAGYSERNYYHVYRNDYKELTTRYTRGTYTQYGPILYTFNRTRANLSLAQVGSTELNISGGTINGSIYGGGRVAKVAGNSTINISGGIINGNVYGGGDGTVIPTVTLSYSTSPTTYADIAFSWAGEETFDIDSGIYSPTGNAPIDYTNRKVYSPDFKYMGSVDGNTEVNISGTATITGEVYGGGNKGNVFGTSTVNISGGTIGSATNNVYSGGNTGYIKQNTTLNISGGVIKGSAFAGGNQADIGSGTINNGIYTNVEEVTSTVNMTGGRIEKSLYGGGFTSKIWGNAIINIGDEEAPARPIQILGTVFGGGEKESNEIEGFNFDFISVTSGIDINIDGQKQNISINGSIFGSGNASSNAGISNINIKNLGSSNDIKKMISIQRTNNLDIHNSNIHLVGAIDSTNDFPTEIFTLNRIDNFMLRAGSTKGSTLYLENGSNLLMNFNSLDENYIPMINETNEVFIKQGSNIKVTTSQNASSFGPITGIAYLGIFDVVNDEITKGIYSKEYATGTIPSNDDLNAFNQGAYVLGLHSTNPETNGFISAFIDEDNKIYYDYINPTPSSKIYHYWRIGGNTETISFNLTASKNGLIGKYYEAILPLTGGDTIYTITNVDTSKLQGVVNLLNPQDLLNTYSNQNDANNNFALTMKTGRVGWSSNEEYYFTKSGSGSVGTAETMISESVTIAPTMEFYLANALNLNDTNTAGEIVIVLDSETKIDELETEFKTIIFKITIDRAVYNDTHFDAAITPGIKTNVFGNVEAFITPQSSISTYFAYYGIYNAGNPYQYSNYTHSRSLNVTNTLPSDTKITLINRTNGNIKYYYYKVTALDEASNKTSYDLSKFKVMGTTDQFFVNINYPQQGIIDEVYTFNIDFSDTNASPVVNNVNMKIDGELNSNVETIITTNPSVASSIKYTILDGEATFTLNGSLKDNKMYNKDKLGIDIHFGFNHPTNLTNQILDTKFYDEKLGFKFTLFNDSHVQIPITTGVKFIIGNDYCLASVDGSCYLPISSNIRNLNATIVMDSNDYKGIPTGNYILKVQAFQSANGKNYNSNQLNNDIVTLQFEVLDNLKYGVKANVLNKYDSIFDAGTEKTISYTFDTSIPASSPNSYITVSLEKKINQIHSSFDYNLINMNDYLTNTLTSANNPNEFRLSNLDNWGVTFNNSLPKGTYYITFKLYDGIDNQKYKQITKKQIIVK